MRFLIQKDTKENAGQNSAVIEIQMNCGMFLTSFPKISFFWEYYPNIFENLASKG